MKISENGLNFIKSFEGCILTAKKYIGEQYYTIGYGHYGADVKAGQTITQEQAENLLRQDIVTYEQAVERQAGYLNLNQNEFDALVSFCYNLGEGCVKQLTANKTRSKEEVAEHIVAYYHSGNPANEAGLKRRRNAERELFLSPIPNTIVLAHLIAKKDAVPLRYSKSHGENNVIQYLNAGTPVDLLEHEEENWGRIAQGYINIDDFNYSIIKHVKISVQNAPLRTSTSHTDNNVIKFCEVNEEYDIVEVSTDEKWGRAIQGWLNLEDCKED